MSKTDNILSKWFATHQSNGDWMVILRVGAALSLIGKIISELPYLDLLYGSKGFVPADIAVFSQNPYIPTIAGIFYALPAICSESFFLKAFFACHLISTVALLTGYKTRLSAFICWSLMVIVFNSSHLMSYGFDAILLSLLFYCLIFPVGRYYSLDSRSTAISMDGDISMTTIFHKVIQLHVCLIYLANGISKTGGAWHDGSGIWDAINQPQFQSMLTPTLQKLLMINHIPAVVSMAVIFIEISYPFMIRVKKVGVVIFILILLLHVFIAIIMGLWLFSFAMIVLNLVAFGHVLAVLRLPSRIISKTPTTSSPAL